MAHMNAQATATRLASDQTLLCASSICPKKPMLGFEECSLMSMPPLKLDITACSTTQYTAAEGLSCSVATIRPTKHSPLPPYINDVRLHSGAPGERHVAK